MEHEFEALRAHVSSFHHPVFALLDRLVPSNSSQPLAPQPFAPLLQEIRRSRITGIFAALDTLIATGRLASAGDHVYFGTQVDEIRARLVATLQGERPIAVSRFRDVVSTTRK